VKPRACSGAMYSGVPATRLALVEPNGPSATSASVTGLCFARPKSSTFTMRSPVDCVARNTFDGLRSR